MYESINIVFQLLANLTDRAVSEGQDLSNPVEAVNFFNFFQTLYASAEKARN